MGLVLLFINLLVPFQCFMLARLLGGRIPPQADGNVEGAIGDKRERPGAIVRHWCQYRHQFIVEVAPDELVLLLIQVLDMQDIDLLFG